MLGINQTRWVKAFGSIGLYMLAAQLMHRQPRILMYHRFSEQPRPGFVSQQVFYKQLHYLQQHFRLMSLTELNEVFDNTGMMPSNTVVITVDDGYEDFYRFAYPLLEKMKIPATLFVTTGFIDGELWLWPDQVRYLLERTNRLPQDIEMGNKHLRAGIVTPSLRERYWQTIIAYLLTISDADKKSWMQKFSISLQIVLPVQPPSDYAACSWDQLQSMQGNGIDIGAHTVTHPSLTQLPLNRAELEISESLQQINHRLGERKRCFCYPNGTANDVNNKLAVAVEQCGFLSAVVAYHDNQNLEDRFQLRRHAAGVDMFQFYKSASGLETIADCLQAQRVVSQE